MNALARVWRHQDFRRNPVRALWRRADWRIRWRFFSHLWIHPFGPGLRIALPLNGTAVQIHYQGLSEPETAAFIQRYLRPGMTFWDVGAHIGEYTLLAAHAVGRTGQVHAFEANPAMSAVLQTNVSLNRFATVTCREEAVSDRVGEAEFQVHAQPALSSLRPEGVEPSRTSGAGVIRVPTTTLDDYADRHGVPHVIKIDVEGAELLVFRGGQQLLARTADAAPVVIFEYSPGNYEALGLDASDTVGFLRQCGYCLYRLDPGGGVTPFQAKGKLPATFNLVAAKTPIDPKP